MVKRIPEVKKAIVSGAGFVVGLGACIGTDAPPWVIALIGVATVFTTWKAKNADPSVPAAKSTDS